MAYDEKLANRIRTALKKAPHFTEKKMFGGLAFLYQGNMCCGVIEDKLVLRIGPEQHEECLAKPHVSPMDFTGRPMRGMIYVSQAGLKTDASLASWVEKALHFTSTLPPK